MLKVILGWFLLHIWIFAVAFLVATAINLASIKPQKRDYKPREYDKGYLTEKEAEDWGRPFPQDKYSYSFYPTNKNEKGVYRNGMRFRFHKDLDINSLFVKGFIESYQEKDYAVENVFIKDEDLIVDMYHFTRIEVK